MHEDSVIMMYVAEYGASCSPHARADLQSAGDTYWHVPGTHWHVSAASHRIGAASGRALLLIP